MTSKKKPINIDKIRKQHDRLHDQMGRRLKQLEKEYGSIGFGFFAHEFDEKFLSLREKFSKTIHQISDYYKQIEEGNGNANTTNEK